MNNEEKSDEQIVKEVINGDSDKFSSIVVKYQSAVFNIGMRFFHNEDDAYDFVQDVFIRAFQKLEQFRGVAPFRFWLMRLAFNAGINSKKAYKQADTLDSALYLASQEKGPDGLQEENEVKKVLLNAISKLPERYRVCVDFYFFYNLSYNEISGITGFSVNTIKSHILRAKRELYASLSGTIAEDYHEM